MQALGNLRDYLNILWDNMGNITPTFVTGCKFVSGHNSKCWWFLHRKQISTSISVWPLSYIHLRFSDSTVPPCIPMVLEATPSEYPLSLFTFRYQVKTFLFQRAFGVKWVTGWHYFPVFMIFIAALIFFKNAATAFQWLFTVYFLWFTFIAIYFCESLRVYCLLV